MPDRVLVVEHQAGVSSGLLGPALTGAGFVLEVCRPYEGHRLPAPDELTEFSAVLILGGSMAAWEVDKAPWINELRLLVQTAEDGGVPTLGICLGHQIAADALGGRVAVNPNGRMVDVVRAGWNDPAAADPLAAGLRGTLAVHGNRDVVTEAPDGAEVLALAPDGTIQAARWGKNVWGVQFHPEAGSEMVEAWVTKSPQLFEEAGMDGQAFLAAVQAHDEEIAEAATRLAENFAAIIRSQVT